MRVAADVLRAAAGGGPSRSRTQRPARRERGRRARHLVAGAGAALASLVAVAIVALALALTAVPAIVGGHTLTVLSGSMVPALPVGSVVVDRPTAPASLRVGDIITYAAADPATGASELVTHRVVAIQRDRNGLTFVTKGDANNVVDREPVAASAIRGKLWYDVPYIGVIRNVVLTKGAALVAGAVLLLLVGAWLLRRNLRPDDPHDTERNENAP